MKKNIINTSEPLIKNRQSGQAIAEFVVFALFVMAPVFLMIPVLGKIADMNQKTVLASRYGAWERTIATPAKKSELTITNEARMRFFARNNKYIKTGEAINEKNSERSRYWRMISASYDPMLTKFSDVNSKTSTSTPGTATKKLFQAADFAMNLRLDRLGKRDFDQTYDIYRSDMSMPVATNSRLDPLKNGIDCAGKKSTKTFLCIKRHNAIYTDTWNAGSRNMVVSRVKHNMLTEDPISSAFETGLKKTLGLLSFMFKEVNWLDLGKVEPDVLPKDRLGGGITYKSN